jgi:flagellar biosynthesis protein FlhG
MLTNLCAAGSRYLGIALQPAGFVRADPLSDQARRLQLPVVEAFKASGAAQDLRQVAADLLQWPHPPAAAPRPSLLAGLH